MNLQVILSTMHQTDHSILDKMNIQSDAVVVNQCDRNEFEEFEYKGYKIKWISLKERGVGLSRNTAMMRADADILLFADDDVVYEDGYRQKILQEFENNPSYGMICFRVDSKNEERAKYHHKPRKHRIRWYNAGRYATFSIAVRRVNVLKSNIAFTLIYGGGTPYSCGEDGSFIWDFLKKNKAMESTCKIGNVYHQTSTWWTGECEKYYYDQGYHFANIFGRWAYIITICFDIKTMFRKRKYGFFTILKWQIHGVRNYFKRGMIDYQDKKLL